MWPPLHPQLRLDMANTSPYWCTGTNTSLLKTNTSEFRHLWFSQTAERCSNRPFYAHTKSLWNWTNASDVNNRAALSCYFKELYRYWYIVFPTLQDQQKAQQTSFLRLLTSGVYFIRVNMKYLLCWWYTCSCHYYSRTLSRDSRRYGWCTSSTAPCCGDTAKPCCQVCGFQLTLNGRLACDVNVPQIWQPCQQLLL